MSIHQREGQTVVELAMGPRTEWTTTRDFFTESAFLQVRAGIEKLESTRLGINALSKLKTGEVPDPAESKLLKDSLGGYDNRNAVKAVSDWARNHGKDMPAKILKNDAGRVIFPSELANAAHVLAETLGPRAGEAVETMRKIQSGAEVSKEARDLAKGAFEKTGLVTPQGELGYVGEFLLGREGAKFLSAEGISQGTGSSRFISAPGSAVQQSSGTAVTAARPKPG